ncbi:MULTISPECIES: hypothetical protein [unclassified Acinetobacter]|uniref:hypothetical protein n=1 Tax=unclassified Acinetobacter TaxID=196816 RepID=UPI0035B7EF2B
MIDKSKIYIAYVLCLSFILFATLFPRQTATYKSGLAYFATAKYSPQMMIAFCIIFGGAIFIKGFLHPDVNRLWTLLFGMSILLSIAYTLLRSGWF